MNESFAPIGWGEARRDIACPRCGTPPVVGVQWMCGPDGCGFPFETFDTHAVCPRCDAHFTVTWCPRCGQPSPHTAWYRGTLS